MTRPLRCALVIDASPAAVHRALRRVDVWTRTMRALGYRLRPAGETDGHDGTEAADTTGSLPQQDGVAAGELHPGQRLRFSPDSAGIGGLARTAALQVTDSARAAGSDPDEPAVPVMMLTLGSIRGRLTVRTAGTGAGTLTTAEIVCGGSLLPAPAQRRRILAIGQMLLGIVTVTAYDPTVVVAGAVIRDRRVLAARRARPTALAGLWEMPGGKVEPAETEQIALVRELREELGIDVEVGERLRPSSIDLGDGLELRPFLAALVGGDPEPRENDPAHDQVRWLSAEELSEVPFLPGDAPMVDAVRVLLGGTPRVQDNPGQGSPGGP